MDVPSLLYNQIPPAPPCKRKCQYTYIAGADMTSPSAVAYVKQCHCWNISLSDIIDITDVTWQQNQ